MDSLPLHLKLQDQPCLVVGGGEVALRKCDLLIRAGARVILVALEVDPLLEQKVRDSGGQIHLRGYQPSDIQGVRLVIAATDDQPLNESIFQDAEAAGVLVNVVDAPALCRFVFPAIIDRSPLIMSASTTGGHPVLSRVVRTQLETSFPAAYGEYAKLLAHYRTKTKTRFDSIDARRIFWEEILASPVTEMALAGNIEGARARLEAAIDDYFERNLSPSLGEVYLIGAGPGDPDLMTFRAVRLLQSADVVIFDRLVSQGIVDLARRDAQKIFAGKQSRNHAIPQGEINALLVSMAQEGKRVCRLKGGDPFIFGRGGEEIETLAAHNIPFQVVPGVTAAAGCAAYAGIPLTHRDYAQSVRFLTGHMKNDHLDLPWSTLTNLNETLVFYMGVASLPVISSQLVAHGLPADCPAALVERGTLPEQRVLTGQLGQLPELAHQAAVQSPALLIVGQVVQLRSKLNWFHNKS